LPLKSLKHGEPILHGKQSGGVEGWTGHSPTAGTPLLRSSGIEWHQANPGAAVLGDHHAGTQMGGIHQPGQMVVGMPQAHLLERWALVRWGLDLWGLER